MFKEKLIVTETLNKRNALLADFWFREPSQRFQLQPALIGLKVIVIDGEDTFTEMLAQQLTAIGLIVTIRKHYEPTLEIDNWDLVVMGPGPGDPRNSNEFKMRALRAFIRNLLAKQYPFLAICLSHQLLCLELGLKLIRREPPNQGVQREINFFGKRELVGLYNTYVAICSDNEEKNLKDKGIKVCREQFNNEVYALHGPQFFSFQFHPESLLTTHGINIITSSLKEIINK